MSDKADFPSPEVEKFRNRIIPGTKSRNDTEGPGPDSIRPNYPKRREEEGEKER